MRYVNRRRLLIVVVLAAFYGAVLPYVQYPFLPYVDSEGRVSSRTVHTRFQEVSIRTHFTDLTNCGYFVLPEAGDAEELQSRLHGLVPRELVRSVTTYGNVGVYRLGWPFRASYWYSCMATANGTYQRTWLDYRPVGWDWLDKRMPTRWPVDVIWWGLLGNVVVVTASAAGIYWSLAYFRAHHRIKRGKCWKCGYLSNGAAVCPECRAGVKA